MKRNALKLNDGSALVLGLVTLAVLSMVVGTAYTTLIPRYRSVYQAASWQEAFHGAEAGIEVSVNALNQFARANPDPATYPWTTSGWSYSDPQRRYDLNGERTMDNPPELGGTNHVAVSQIAVDVYTRDLTAESNPWFRIRSTAHADLPGRSVTSDRRDIALRRMKLNNRTVSGSSAPYVSRTIEVIVKPVSRFNRAILVAGNLSLGSSNNWLVDSFDSSSSAKSDPGPTLNEGVYPDSSTKQQANGSIATAKTLPNGTLYGALIDGSGAVVKGDVQTNGGDNPDTIVHENVSGSGGMTQSRIKDDFNEDIPSISAPEILYGLPNSGIFTAFPSGGTRTSPFRYKINGSLGGFTILPPADGTSIGYVDILVTRNLDIGNGNGAYITIPPRVFARVFVIGNIDFGNGEVNSNGQSSQVASHLRIYGIGTSGTYTASGNGTIIAAIAAPTYDITLSGTTTSIGAVVGKSFNINGGGHGGFHYDEALGKGGDIASWKVASYFDDARADL